MQGTDPIAGFELCDEFWSRFVDEGWERQPIALTRPFADPLSSDPELLDIVRKIAARYRAGDSRHRQPGSGDIVRLNVGHSLCMTDVGPLLPGPSDESLGAYVARIGAALDGQPFELVANDVQVHDFKLLTRVRAFLAGLFRRVGLPSLKAEAVLFLRDHEMTSFGVHKDDASVFMFVLHGQKRILTWPAERFSDPHIPTDYAEFRDDATVLDAEPGDVIYWPSHCWHVGESKRGLSASISVAVRLGQRPMTEISHHLARLAFAADANDTVGTYGGDAIGNDLPRPISDALATATSIVASDALEAELATWWINRRTGGGFSLVPPPEPVRHVADDDVVRKSPESQVLWLQRADGRLVCSTNGHSVIMMWTDSARVLFEHLNGGEPWRLGDLLHRCDAASDGWLRETLRLLVAELVARRGVTVEPGRRVVESV